MREIPPALAQSLLPSVTKRSSLLHHRANVGISIDWLILINSEAQYGPGSVLPAIISTIIGMLASTVYLSSTARRPNAATQHFGLCRQWNMYGPGQWLLIVSIDLDHLFQLRFQPLAPISPIKVRHTPSTEKSSHDAFKSWKPPTNRVTLKCSFQWSFMRTL